MKKSNQLKSNPAALLKDWIALQHALRGVKRSAALLPLLRLAVKNNTRPLVKARIYSRFNKLRVSEELALLRTNKLPTYLK